jgi:lipoprotein signal peptidase
VAADQLIKWWWLASGAAVINRGVAGGIWADDRWWLVAGGIVAYLWWTKRGLPWELIVAGGLSNFGDRLVRGGVVDGNWGFNLADVAIIAGSLWLIASRQ